MFVTFHAIILKVEPSKSETVDTKTEFDMNINIILGHSFCNQLKADKGQYIAI